MAYEAVAGIVAGILTLIANTVYVVDTMRAGVRPSRATWFIWMSVNWIIALSYKSSGADWSSLNVFGFAIGATALFILSVFRGVGGLTRFDLGCFLAAVVSISLWLGTSSPLMALGLSLGTNAIGTIPTLRKLWREEGKESIWAWLFWVMSNVVNFTVAMFNRKAAVIIPPVYYFIQCSCVLFLIRRLERREKQNTQPD